MNKNRVIGIILAAVAVLFLIMTNRLPVSQYATAVGPKVFPNIASVGLLLCAAGLFFKRMPSEKRKPFLDKAGWIRVLKLGLLLALYPVMFGFLGFIVESLVLLYFMITVFDLEKQEPVWKRLAVTGVTTAALYFLFVFAINIRLPAGRVFELLR